MPAMDAQELVIQLLAHMPYSWLAGCWQSTQDNAGQCAKPDGREPTSGMPLLILCRKWGVN